MTLNRIRELSRRTARSITEWGSPTDREEVFSWQHLAPCESVLDVACGNGSFIAKRPAGVTGLDIDEENVARCRAQGFPAVVGNALDLPYPDASFDGVHSAHVLFALQAKAAVQYLNELVRVTRPGGIIALSSLCDVQEVFDYPEVARPYPPQAIFRMIRKPDTNVGAEVRGVSYKAIAFRRQPLINFRFSSLTLWRVASLLNAVQYGLFLRKYWKYRGYTIILQKASAPSPVEVQQQIEPPFELEADNNAEVRQSRRSR